MTMPPDLPDRILSKLREHTHYFRHIGSKWVCACGHRRADS